MTRDWWRLLDAPYRAVDAVRAGLYLRGPLSRQRLASPTISVGGLHAGGAGKTPVALDLARRDDVILIRGYGGQGRGPRVVVADGDGPEAPPWAVILSCAGERRTAQCWSREIGDEAALIAGRRPGSVVGVGVDRAATARAVARQHTVRRFVLDDGFAHHRVFRDVDLVCLAVVRRGDALQLRPGFRRHGTGALARASAVIVVAEGLPVLEPEAVDALRRALGFGGLTAAARKVTGSMWSYPDGATVEPGALRGRRAATVCAIGDPGSFSRLASDELALEVVARRDATDHHRFEAGELDAVETYAGDHGATMVLTTGKDAVRLPPAWSPRLTWVVLEPRLCWDVGYAQLSRELEAL